MVGIRSNIKRRGSSVRDGNGVGRWILVEVLKVREEVEVKEGR